jgi:hypothetical protein
VERERKPSASHGRERIGEVAARLEASIADAPLFSGGAAARPPLMFFDLETTGLNGGAGTHVFLIGCGWFDEDRFLTRQFVMTRFSDERPMLQAVARAFDRAGALVSFNGKSFDAPVLETRYLFHRLEWFGGETRRGGDLEARRLLLGGACRNSWSGIAGSMCRLKCRRATFHPEPARNAAARSSEPGTDLRCRPARPRPHVTRNGRRGA